MMLDNKLPMSLCHSKRLKELAQTTIFSLKDLGATKWALDVTDFTMENATVLAASTGISLLMATIAIKKVP